MVGYVDGITREHPAEDSFHSASTNRLISAMSQDGREEIDMRIFIGELLDSVYCKHHSEIEMLFLSISNYTHEEISKVLDISRIGVTKRISRARDILKDQITLMEAK